MPQAYLSCTAFLLAFLLQVHGDLDIKVVLKQAASEFAASAGTSINQSTFSDGLCFASAESQTCQDHFKSEPTSFAL